MNQAAVPDGQPDPLSAVDPLAGLARWIADEAVGQAAGERARQAWLRQQAGESASLAGILTDHAEAGRRVVTSTLGGRRASGLITAVGIDFAAVREPDLGEVIIPLSRLAIVRTAPGDAAAIGDRAQHYEVVMAHALAELAAERPTVLVAAGNEAARGALQSVGTDVITVLINGPQRSSVHVALAAIDHIVILTC